MSDDPPDHQPPAPPAPPRELSPHVRRRAWSERQVRTWLILALAMFAIAAYYAAVRSYDWSRETSLIRSGANVDAEIMGWEPGVDVLKGKVIKELDTPIDIKYTYNGQTYRPHGVLAGRTEQIVTRTIIPIYVDPKDPIRWTARTQPAPLTQEMLPAIILTPFVVVLAALTLWKRAQVLRTYQTGESALAEVVGVAQSAMAPLSRMLRCALHADGEGGARVVRLVLPARLAPPVGDLLWVIYPPRRPDRAIPAALFE